MADEGDNLHDPWAPPPDAAPAAPEADVPTRVTPIEPTVEGIDAPPLPPDEPELLPEIVPPESEVPPPRRHWPGAAKAIVAVLAVLLVATAVGLGYGWWKSNDDKKELESTSNQQGQELSQQLDKANQDNATAQQQLATANTKITDQQTQITGLQSQLTAAQDEAAAAKQQSAALAGLFPLTPQKLQPGLPGTYRSDAVQPAPGGCSLASCPPVQLTMTIESSGGALTVSDPALGRLPLTPVGGGWSATGAAPAAFQLQCNAAPQPTTFTITLAATVVALDSKNAPQVATLGTGFLLSSAPVAGTAEPANAGCPPGVAAYLLSAART
jgi:TolA-binding protein